MSDWMLKQQDNSQLIRRVKHRIMGLPVCTIPGQQAQHGLHAVASFQSAGRTAVGVGGDLGVVLAVGGEAHDVVPVEAAQLRQVVAVEVGVVGENASNTVLAEPGSQVPDRLGTGAEDGLHRRVQKQGVVVHAANLALVGQDMVFHFHRREGVRVGNHRADGHDLVGPVGFSINDGEFSHVCLFSLVVLQIVYRKMGKFAISIKK